MALQRLPLVIAGTDFTAAVQRLAYSVEYEERTGDNSTLLKSGDKYLDILAKRPIVTWPLNMLWADEMAALEAAIDTATYVPVYYFDRKLGAAKIGQFHGLIGSATVGLIRQRAYAYRDGAVLTLRSR